MKVAKELAIGTAAAVLGAPMAFADVATPTGLAPGSSYDVIFVTSDQTQARSADISTYNGIANTDATQAGLPGAKAIAGTPTVTALQNICGASTAACADVPVYDVAGNLIANSVASLFDAANIPLLHPITLTQTGAAAGASYIWTGSAPDGTLPSFRTFRGSPVFTSITVTSALGGVPKYGSSYGADGVYGSVGQSFLRGNSANHTRNFSYPLYGLSSPLTVAAPEPSSMYLLLSGVAGGLAFTTRRRRRRAG